MRQVNMFGIPFTVGTMTELREEIGDARPGENVHIVVRVVDSMEDDVPPALRARRRRTPCEGCREICWYDPDSIVDPQAQLLCLQCLPKRLQQESQNDR